MQRKKKQEAEAARTPQGLAPPAPDPRHPEAVLDTVPRAAGIDVHKMSLTCTVLVEDDSGRVASETRQYRTYGAELRLLVGWLAGLDLSRVVMESTGVFWKSVQRALSAAGRGGLGRQCPTRQGVRSTVQNLLLCRTDVLVRIGHGIRGLRVSFLVEHSCDSCVVGQRVESARLVQPGHDGFPPQQSPLAPLPHRHLRNTG